MQNDEHIQDISLTIALNNNQSWKYEPNSILKTCGAPLGHDKYTNYYENVINILEEALTVAKTKFNRGFHWSDCALHNEPMKSCDCK